MTFHKNKTILTFVWSHKGPRRAKATLKKENGPEASPSLTSHYVTKLQSQKSVELAQKQAHRAEEQNREPRNQPTGMWPVIHKKGAKNIHQGKDSPLNKRCWENRTPHAKEKHCTLSTPRTKGAKNPVFHIKPFPSWLL